MYVCERARDLGCMMLTGNEYLDKRLGVGAVLLGHGYPAVDKEAWKAVEVSDMDKESSSAVT
ncbi:MAG: hypothetical protein QW057_06890 [Candidatus Bathyarchaeia archaeon]